jgi:outer membrane lipoprotein-sorting protein
MIKAMREADSLYYESDYRIEARGGEVAHATYRAWLKKPNQFRVEASRFGKDEVAGVLVGDGDHLWIHWPAGKPRYGWEYSGEWAEQYEKHRLTSYMKKRAPLGGHSIAHETGKLGASMSMTILDTTTEAFMAMAKYETFRGRSAVPMTYVIDREGKAVDAWYGYQKKKTEEAVKKLKLNKH